MNSLCFNDSGHVFANCLNTLHHFTRTWWGLISDGGWAFLYEIKLIGARPLGLKKYPGTCQLNNPLPGATRVLELERLERAAAAVRQQLTVFVAGPFINVNKAEPKGKGKEAARLRHNIYHHLAAEGFNVTLGEFGALVDAHKEVLGEYHDATFSEIGHAKLSADAIIMLPSSPGSFLELGAFSLDEIISSKMLIVVEKKYENPKGYLHLGPLVGAKNNRAEVLFESYSDLDACKHAVRKFLLKISQRKMAKEYLPK